MQAKDAHHSAEGATVGPQSPLRTQRLVL